MMARLFSGALALGLLATSVAAEPCVSSTFNQPLPGATQVETHVSDVPSAQFPGFWQDGIIDGYAYTIFASAEGTLRPTDIREEWAIEITCDLAEQACQTNHTGTPPQGTQTVSKLIGKCLLGAELVTPEPELPPEFEAAPVLAVAAPASEETEQTTVCAAATVDEANEIASLQRLLILVGEDPGMVDGILGSRSLAAIEAFSSRASTSRTVPEVIALLQVHLCQP